MCGGNGFSMISREGYSSSVRPVVAFIAIPSIGPHYELCVPTKLTPMV